MEDTTQEGDTDNIMEELGNGVTAKEDSEEEEEEEGEGGFFDPGAEFLADVRNALGDLAAVDSDQVTWWLLILKVSNLSLLLQESIMSIDEEEMEALDEALSVVFQKKQEKAEKKKQKKSEWKDLHVTMTSLSLPLSLSLSPSLSLQVTRWL